LTLLFPFDSFYYNFSQVLHTTTKKNGEADNDEP